MGLPVPDRERASHVIGLGLHDSLRQRRARRCRPSATRSSSPLYRRHFLAREDTMRLFAGMPELLASSRREPVPRHRHRQEPPRASTARSRRAACGGFFAASRCADETSPKPHPAMLLELMDELRCSGDGVLMIGDTSHDLEMAQRRRRRRAGGDLRRARRARAARLRAAAAASRRVERAGGMADDERLICASGGAGRLRAAACASRSNTSASRRRRFAVRHAGRVHGYLNRCAHVAMELDWQEGVFFDFDGRDLICSTHGATYDAASGQLPRRPVQPHAAGQAAGSRSATARSTSWDSTDD